MILVSICSSCVHLVKKPREEMLKNMECKAFPDGIPQELIFHLHNKPYPGDHGIMFEQDPDTPYKVKI